MDHTRPSADRERRFRELYDAAYADLLRFVQRRCDHARADDIVAEAMLTAWRRLDDVPGDLSDARARLFIVARNTLQDEYRRQERRDALAVQLAEVGSRQGVAHGAIDAAEARLDIAAAWPHLSAVHQEALALSILDGLAAPEAARVLGISSTAFRLRLSRARRALRSRLSSDARDAVDGPRHDVRATTRTAPQSQRGHR